MVAAVTNIAIPATDAIFASYLSDFNKQRGNIMNTANTIFTIIGFAV